MFVSYPTASLCKMQHDWMTASQHPLRFQKCGSAFQNVMNISTLSNALVNIREELWLAHSDIPPLRKKCSGQAGLPGSLPPCAEILAGEDGILLLWMILKLISKCLANKVSTNAHQENQGEACTTVSPLSISKVLAHWLQNLSQVWAYFQTENITLAPLFIIFLLSGLITLCVGLITCRNEAQYTRKHKANSHHGDYFPQCSADFIIIICTK